MAMWKNMKHRTRALLVWEFDRNTRPGGGSSVSEQVPRLLPHRPFRNAESRFGPGRVRGGGHPISARFGLGIRMTVPGGVVLFLGRVSGLGLLRCTPYP